MGGTFLALVQVYQHLVEGGGAGHRFVAVVRRDQSADRDPSVQRHVADDRVDYVFTVNDPKAFAAPFTVEVPMHQMHEELYEYACHEGNYGMVNILRGQRIEDGTYVDASSN